METTNRLKCNRSKATSQSMSTPITQPSIIKAKIYPKPLENQKKTRTKTENQEQTLRSEMNQTEEIQLITEKLENG